MTNRSRSRLACAVLMCAGLSIPWASTAATRAPLPDPAAEMRRRIETMKQLASPRIPATFAELLAQHTSRASLPSASIGTTSQVPSPVGSTTSSVTSAPTSSGSTNAGSTTIATDETDFDGDGTVERKSVTASTLNAQGLPVRQASALYFEGILAHRDLLLVTYDAKGNVVERIYEDDQLGDGTVELRNETSNEYDPSGHVILSVFQQSNPTAGTVQNGYRTTFEYDAAGNILKIVTDVDDDGDGIMDDRSTTTYIRDQQGRVVDDVFTLDKGLDGTLEIENHTANVLDVRGNLVESHTENDESGNGGVILDMHIVHVYDSRSKLVGSIHDVDDEADGTVDTRYTLTITYDDRGNPVLVVSDYAHGPGLSFVETLTSESTFDAQGRPVQVIVTASTGGVATTVIADSYAYNAHGKIASYVSTGDYSADGVLDYRTEITNEFNGRGDVTSNVHTSDSDGDGTIDNSSSNVTTYDPRGNPLQVVSEVDNDADGTFDYRSVLTIQYRRGMEEPVVLEGNQPALQLRAAAPNPFQDVASLGFSLPVEGDVDLQIFDASGRLVRDLVNGSLPAGDHQVSWDGRDDQARVVPNGAYFMRLKAAGRETSRMILRAR